MKLILLIFGTLAAILLSLFFGAANLSVGQTLQALMGHGREIDVTIVRELRLPRALLGAVIGAGLGASGAALQGYTRNPLAAPGILGFTSCAAFGAVIALYFGFSQAVPFAALLGTVLGALLILQIAGPRKGASTLILAGVGVGACLLYTSDAADAKGCTCNEKRSNFAKRNAKAGGCFFAEAKRAQIRPNKEEQ